MTGRVDLAPFEQMFLMLQQEDNVHYCRGSLITLIGELALDEVGGATSTGGSGLALRAKQEFGYEFVERYYPYAEDDEWQGIFKLKGKTYSFPCYENSYDGRCASGTYYNLKEVKPVTKTVTLWE